MREFLVRFGNGLGLDAVVGHLRNSLGRDKIVLIGHSWGAALGLLYAHAHPDVVSAFISVNPLISMRAAQQAQYDFVLAARDLNSHGFPHHPLKMP